MKTPAALALLFVAACGAQSPVAVTTPSTGQPVSYTHLTLPTKA